MKPPPPTPEAAYLAQALAALPVAHALCRCSDHWHLLWAGLKATGVLRGLQAQHAFFADLLQRHRVAAPRVLIAGAADTGSLDLLHQVLADGSAHYTVVDLCPAPLALLRHRADELGLALTTLETGLDELPAAEPWDLVFIHYTLAFMDAAARRRFLQRLTLSPSGVVVCAVREKQSGAEADAAAQVTTWTRDNAARLASTFAAHPERLAPLLQHLPAYARARQQREDGMPRFATVAEEFTAAGFVQLEAHRNPGQLPARSSDLAPPGSIANWVAVYAQDRS